MCPTEGPVTTSCALFAGNAEMAEDVWSKELCQVTSACDTAPMYLNFRFRMSMLQQQMSLSKAILSSAAYMPAIVFLV